MKKKFCLIIFCALLFGFNAPAIAADFEIPGTGDGVAVLKSIAEAYYKQTKTKVTIPHSIGSGGGVIAAGSGKAQLARVARGIKKKEQGFGLEYLPIFDVPTVFFVNSNVQVENVSSTNILDIFSGKINKWSKVGGRDVDIKLYVREAKDSSFNNLKKTFPGFDTLKISYTAIIATKTPYMVKFIKHDENSIGFGPYDVAIENGLNVLSIDGIKPNEANYPYHGTIGLVFQKDKLSKEAKDFLAFLKTPAAETAIKKAGGNSL